MLNSTQVDKNLQVDLLAECVSDAQTLLKTNRTQGLKALNELFRSGTVPNPALNGSYRGELIAFDIAPGLTHLAQVIVDAWMPWKGKTFNVATDQGDNIFHRGSYVLAHVLWPLYHDYKADSMQTYRAFTFRTYTAPGKDDPDTQVLKIDYDRPGNPSLSIRRVLDELVQVEEGFYLGKAHLKWWWGRWQMVAYFSLQAANLL
jgi:hypothetical protein